MSAAIDEKMREAREEAAFWLAKLTVSERTPEDERDFSAWLERHPRNAEAFDWVNGIWETAGGLRGMDIPREAPPRAALSRRAVLAGAAGVLAMAGGLGFWQEARAEVYETGVGEQRRVTLDDGSRLLLDTDTRIRVRFSKRERKVELQRGRVNCTVAPEPDRPFVVEAGARRLTATDATFDVRRDAGAVSVTLIEGQVMAPSERAAEPPRVIVAGQRLIDTPAAPERIVPLDIAKAIAWQDGRAVFEDGTLASAVAEMNRYSNTKLEIADPAIGELRVSGVFRTGDNAAFARTVALFLPVAARADGGRITLIAARNPSRSSGG